MKRFTRLGITCLLLAGLTLIMTSRVAARADYENGLERVLLTAPPNSMISIVVTFNDPLDPEQVRLEIEGMNLSQRREYVIDRLKQHLEDSAWEAIDWIESEAEIGQAENLHPLWIAHSYWLHLRADRISTLASLPQVFNIIYDPPIHIDDCIDDAPVRDSDPQPLIRWNIEAIGAHVLWEQGYCGEGAIIGVIDTGCDLDHPDLENRIWVNEDEIPDNDIDDDENGYVDDINGWNFYNNNNNVSDTHDHGTKASGILVSDGSNRNDTLGVAPGATLIVIRNWGPNWSSEATRFAASQYAADNGADVISCSMSYDHAPNAFNVTHRNTMVWMLLMGVIYANSQGNHGEFGDFEEWNINPPADCPPPWLHPDQRLRGGLSAMMGIGAFDRGGNINRLSSRGPAIWDHEGYPDDYRDYPYDPPDLMGLLKPDIVAPTGAHSTIPGGRYTTYTFTGESCAAPHAAGCFALLRSIHTEATPAMICEAVKMTAEDGGERGHDNVYGAGRIRVDLAHEYLENWDDFGSLIVTIEAVCEGMVEGALVEVNDNEVRAWSDEDGIAFMQRVMPGNHTVWVFTEELDTVSVENVEVVTAETTMVYVVLIGQNIHILPCALDTSITSDETLNILFEARNLTEVEFTVDVELQYSNGEEVDVAAFDIDDTVTVQPGGTEVQFSLYGSQFETGDSLDLELIWTRSDGEWEFVVPMTVLVLESAASTQSPALPPRTVLLPPSPNPFNSTVRLEYRLRQTGNITLEVYNLLGQRVATLEHGRREAGHYNLSWNSNDAASGLYFAVLKTGSEQFVAKMLLVR